MTTKSKIRIPLYLSHLILGLLVWVTPVFPTPTELIWLNTPLKLDTPMVTLDDTLYFPVRDSLSRLNGRLKYYPKNNTYQLHISNKTGQKIILLVPFSNEIWVNRTTHFLTKPVKIWDNRLYVPLCEWVKLLGLSCEVGQQSVRVKTGSSIYQAPNLTPSKRSGPELRRRIDPLDGLGIPTLETDRPAYLSFGKKKYRIQNRFKYVDDELYLDLKAILSASGFKTKIVGGTWTISKNTTKIILKSGSSEVEISAGKLKRSIFSARPLKHIRNKTYIHFETFISAFGFGVHWSSVGRTVYVLNQINKVWFDEKSGGIRFEFSFPSSLPNLSMDDNTNKSSVELPLMASNLNKKKLSVNRSGISHVTIDQSGTSTWVTFSLKPDISVAPVKSESGLLVAVIPSIVRLSESKNKNRHQIKIIGSMPFSKSIWENKSPNKLVIDIPNSRNQLPALIRAKHGYYKRIRTAQHSTKNGQSTRVVVDLYDHLPYKIVHTRPKELNVLFDVSKIKTQIHAPKSKGLVDKIIAIDPGHGGRDPGALGFGLKEKVYTLDISKRLKQRLEQAGAVPIMLREGDGNPSLQARANQANRNRADIVISVHINSFYKPFANGTETYYYKRKDKRLARHIQREMVKTLKLKNNGTKRAKFYILNHSRAPAALVEPAFITNPKDVKKIQSPEFRQKVADSIFRGIQTYFGSKK